MPKAVSFIYFFVIRNCFEFRNSNFVFSGISWLGIRDKLNACPLRRMKTYNAGEYYKE